MVYFSCLARQDAGNGGEARMAACGGWKPCGKSQEEGMEGEDPQPWRREGQATSQWRGKRTSPAGEPAAHSKMMRTFQNVSEGPTMAAAEQDVVTVEEATGLNQALFLQCSLVPLQDSPKKSQKEELPGYLRG